MKKRFLCLVLAFCMVLGCMGSAAAATVPGQNEGGIGNRAVSVPTSLAPSSWYGVAHNWTATYYTYSSYWFTTNHEFGLDIDVYADAPFHVVFVTRDGTRATMYAEEFAYGGYYVGAIMEPGVEFYLIIYNDSGATIASNATYLVQVPLDRD